MDWQVLFRAFLLLALALSACALEVAARACPFFCPFFRWARKGLKHTFFTALWSKLVQQLLPQLKTNGEGLSQAGPPEAMVFPVGNKETNKKKRDSADTS